MNVQKDLPDENTTNVGPRLDFTSMQVYITFYIQL